MMRTFLVLLSLVLSIIIGTHAVCQLTIEEPRPIILKDFGSKTSIIKKKLTSLQLATNETISLHCPTGLVFYSSQMTKINLATSEVRCEDKGLYFDELKVLQEQVNVIVKCNGGFSQSLYESNTSLVACNDDAMTLLIGHKFDDKKSAKLLGLCYDLSNQRLKFVSYLAYSPTNSLLETEWNNELQRLSLDNYINSINKYFSFPSESEFNSAIQQSKKYDAHFDATILQYSNLLQDESLVTSLQEYNDLLRIIWMKKLRTGNWKRFLDALKQHSTNDETDCKYDVRVGVSDVATVPRLDHKSYTSPIVIKVSSFNLEMPAYIWAHLRFLGTVKGAAREFVVVGQNSPYANIADMYNFCSDICPEIPFLKDSEFGLLHLMPEFGVVQCCSVEEAASKLIDFPLQGGRSETASAVMPTRAAIAQAKKQGRKKK